MTICEEKLAELEDGAGDILLSIKKQNVDVFRKCLKALEIFEIVFDSEIFWEGQQPLLTQKKEAEKERKAKAKASQEVKRILKQRVRELEQEIKLEDVDAFSGQGLRALYETWGQLKVLRNEISDSEAQIGSFLLCTYRDCYFHDI